eukprot:tig00020537_g10293.t1
MGRPMHQQIVNHHGEYVFRAQQPGSYGFSVKNTKQGGAATKLVSCTVESLEQPPPSPRTDEFASLWDKTGVIAESLQRVGRMQGEFRAREMRHRSLAESTLERAQARSIGLATLLVAVSVSQCVATRDALAKALYSRLFRWLVDRLNRSISGDLPSDRNCVSILDIFGFECFEVHPGARSRRPGAWRSALCSA